MCLLKKKVLAIAHLSKFNANINGVNQKHLEVLKTIKQTQYVTLCVLVALLVVLTQRIV